MLKINPTTLIVFKTVFDDLTVNAILDCVLLTILLIFLNLIINFFVKRKVVTITLLSSSILYLSSYIFYFKALEMFSILVMFLTCITGLFVNLAELRVFFANKAKKTKTLKINNKKKDEVEKIVDHSKVYETINETVLYLSKHKIGALMTFERKDNLTAIMKNGTLLDCPVSFELLVTIFFPGTRLHDGAVVIKDDKIIAASVYYTPTTKPLLGKYGSRHRAAIGISEICDAVTVVVSEETGRISIAYNGEIESYSPEMFKSAFENYMSFSSISTGEELKK